MWTRHRTHPLGGLFNWVRKHVSKNQSPTKKKKNLMLVRLPFGHSVCFVLPCTDSNFGPFTAVIKPFKLLLPRCTRSDLPILTHLHPSFGHEQAMRVYQALIPTAAIWHKSTIPSVSWVRGQWAKLIIIHYYRSRVPSNSPRPKTLVLFTFLPRLFNETLKFAKTASSPGIRQLRELR
jgi:hypothetical protein